MNYPTMEGKYGSIYKIAYGVTVIVSKDGTWELAVNHDGERTRRRFGKDLDEALKAGELIAARLSLSPKPEHVKEEKVYTFREASDDWMRVNKGRWSTNTIERYSGIVRDFLEPSLGNLPIQKVDRQRVKDLLIDTLAIRSAKSVELTHAVISGIFVEAIDNRIVLENPAQGLLKKILPPKRKRNESAPDPLTRDDLLRVLDATRKHVDLDVALVTETLAKSGMRLGECLAMHRNHLDASNCQYMIMETVRHGKFGIPKTGKRLIDLPDDLVARLQSYILRKRKEALSEGKDVTYLFPGITQRLVQKGLERACRTAKVRLRHPHDLRHTYAAILLMDHYSPAYVQKQLGHSSITMTVDTYGHWIPGEGKKDLGKTLGDKMDEQVRRTRRAD